tara:strand:- start:1186 stop:2004 length:819 start_codon:yes stop_codon:yes gene_type:complete
MTKDINQLGFKSIANHYDLFFIDIWGVIHNGIDIYDNAREVLSELKKLDKEFILLTNAPRPNKNVEEFLLKIGLDKIFTSKVYTSGEAALNYLISNYKYKYFYHIGPPRDFSIFKDFERQKIKNIKKADYLLCTGLFDEYNKDLNYYKNILKDEIDKIMICTNPDLIVDRGQTREFCAGSVAKVFGEVGGNVEYFGKPYPKVYNLATKIENRRVLCVGDNLNTDIKGANLQKFSSLLISNGIHRNEIKKDNLKDLFKKYNVKVDFIQKNFKW